MEALAEGRQVSINYDDGHLQIREGTHVRTGNQAILYDNESLVKAAHTVSAPQGLDPKTVRTFVSRPEESAFVKRVTHEMLQDAAFRDETLRSAAILLGQYQTWKGKEVTKGSLQGTGTLKIGAPGGAQLFLKELLGINANLMAQYDITRDKAEEIVADLNYALVKKAWHEAYEEATLHGKLSSPDEDIFREEFHRRLSDLYTSFEAWASGRREDQYGADHLIGEIKDAIPYMKEKTRKFLEGYSKGLTDAVNDAKKGGDDALDHFLAP